MAAMQFGRKTMKSSPIITRRTLLAGGAAAAAMLPSRGFAKTTTLRFATFIGPTSYINTDIFTPWFRQIEKASNGTVRVEFLPGGSAAGPKEVFDAVTAGLVDIGWSISAYNPGRFNAAGITELPVLTRTADEGAAGMAALTEAGMLDGFDDVKLIGIGSADVGRLHHARDVSGLQDFKGAKVRAAGRVLSMMLEKIGGVPIGMPITSVAEALAKNVIDGAAADWLSIDNFRLMDVTRTHLDIALGAPSMYMVMNRASYDRLPDAAKAAFDAASPRAFSEFWSARIMQESNRVREEVQAADGHKIIENLGDAELAMWNGAAEEVIADWTANTARGAEILDVYKTAVEKFRAA